jgi:hypothetical protein
MPEDNGQFRYRIKHSNEAHERVAEKSELTTGLSRPADLCANTTAGHEPPATVERPGASSFVILNRWRQLERRHDDLGLPMPHDRHEWQGWFADDSRAMARPTTLVTCMACANRIL